jgi:xanthine/uracil/vitamin C permease (AzgA family)
MADHSEPRRDGALGTVLDRRFGLTANGTTVRTDFVAGVYTFLTMVRAVVTAIAIPLTFSIATGIGLGFTTYSLCKLLAGRFAVKCR